jgi:hypothetical protein
VLLGAACGNCRFLVVFADLSEACVHGLRCAGESARTLARGRRARRDDVHGAFVMWSPNGRDFFLDLDLLILPRRSPGALELGKSAGALLRSELDRSACERLDLEGQ